jgi:hypothetical protein
MIGTITAMVSEGTGIPAHKLTAPGKTRNTSMAHGKTTYSWYLISFFGLLLGGGCFFVLAGGSSLHLLLLPLLC